MAMIGKVLRMFFRKSSLIRQIPHRVQWKFVTDLQNMHAICKSTATFH